ncbi:hypothetical protein [Streptomyces plumbiresistens]|uniref:hypothetical protein n=1 Tax=Streptomyces plumbiresistens TaxID=511811 RepID=UPI0031E8D785
MSSGERNRVNLGNAGRLNFQTIRTGQGALECGCVSGSSGESQRGEDLGSSGSSNGVFAVTYGP